MKNAPSNMSATVLKTMTTGVDEKLIKEIAKEIKKCKKFDEIIINEAGSTITGHCGPGTFGVLYFRKENK